MNISIFRRFLNNIGVPIQDPATGFLTIRNVAMDGAPPSFTWAGKPAAGATGYANTVVLITDLHSRSTTGGSLWLNTSGGYILISNPVNVTWAQVSSASYFGTAGGALDAATWPGLRLHVTDYGLGGLDIYSDGTRWRLAGGQATLKNYTEAQLSTVAINQNDSIIASATWPKGLYADGDRLNVHLTGQKSGATDTITLKLAYSTDPGVYAGSAVITNTAAVTGATDSVSSMLPVGRKDNVTMKVRGTGVWSPISGPSSSNIASDTAVTNLDTTQGYLIWTCTTAANETFLPSSFMVKLDTCGA